MVFQTLEDAREQFFAPFQIRTLSSVKIESRGMEHKAPMLLFSYDIQIHSNSSAAVGVNCS